MDVQHLAAAERRDLADFLETLTPEQWATPSLCEGWTVADVAHHIVSYDALPLGASVRRVVAGRLATPGRPLDGPNARGVAEARGRRPDEAVALLRRHAEPRGITAGFGGRIALTDTLIHHQDVRRPLGLPREVPADRLRVALPFALIAPVLPARDNVAGLRLVATDVDWSHGDGPEVRGPGEALLMAVSGRAQALAELSGPGLERLTARVHGTEHARAAYDVLAAVTLPVPVESAYELVRGASLAELFGKRYGVIPPVREVRDQSGPWSSPGETRTIALGDGTRLRQELVRVDPHTAIDYRLTDVRGPMRTLVAGVDGRWRFAPDADGTRVTWTWTFRPTSTVTGRLMPVLARSWRGYARRGLDLLARPAAG